MVNKALNTRTVMSTLLGALLLLGTGTAGAHKEKHPQDGHAAKGGTQSKGASADVRLYDLELIDQNGQPARFKSDVIGNRIVVINFIYTSCTTVCPVLSAIFGQVQHRLGSRLGKDVFLVSVSVDPVTDRPQRLRAYAKKNKARPGWIWLTGEKTTVDKVLQGLRAYTPDFEDHPSMMLVGDARSGDWTRFYGFMSPDQVVTKVDELLAARKGTISAERGQRQ